MGGGRVGNGRVSAQLVGAYSCGLKLWLEEGWKVGSWRVWPVGDGKCAS